MVVRLAFSEFLEVQKASGESVARAAFKKFMDRPKMINELDLIVGELSNYGLHSEKLEFGEPEDLLDDVAELARQLEGNGRRLNTYVDAFEWLNYQGIDEMRKNSKAIRITRRNGRVIEGLWCLT